MSRLIIVTALMAEAVPIIDRYRMKKQAREPGFHHYQADGLELLVCGMGAKRMREGLERYFCTRFGSPRAVWMNIGIAGAASHSIGELVWVEQVGRLSIGLPDGVEKTGRNAVHSFAKANHDYRTDLLFDMEAEAWLEVIAKNMQPFSPERLFCAKVISDNSLQHDHSIDKHWVTAIIRENMPELQIIINKILINSRKHNNAKVIYK